MGYIKLQEKHGKTITVTWKGEGKLQHGKGIDPSATLDGGFWYLDMDLTDDQNKTEPEVPKPTPPPEPDPETSVSNEESEVSTTNTDSNEGDGSPNTKEAEIPA